MLQVGCKSVEREPVDKIQIMFMLVEEEGEHSGLWLQSEMEWEEQVRLEGGTRQGLDGSTLRLTFRVDSYHAIGRCQCVFCSSDVFQR